MKKFQKENGFKRKTISNYLLAVKLRAVVAFDTFTSVVLCLFFFV